MDSVNAYRSATVGLPHSEIAGSMRVCRSPTLIAACRVLHRLSVPRHPSCALSSLTTKRVAIIVPLAWLNGWVTLPGGAFNHLVLTLFPSSRLYLRLGLARDHAISSYRIPGNESMAYPWGKLKRSRGAREKRNPRLRVSFACLTVRQEVLDTANFSYLCDCHRRRDATTSSHPESPATHRLGWCPESLGKLNSKSRLRESQDYWRRAMGESNGGCIWI